MPVELQAALRKQAGSSSTSWSGVFGADADEFFHPIRFWNGDQTDWGLNFSSAPQVLRVTLGAY